MRFYTQTRQYHCGIDLHARSLYVCIVDHNGNVLIHKEIKAAPEPLLRLITPYLEQIVIGVECMHCWYWIADFCEQYSLEFILGHALYMRAIHGGKAKNDRIDSHKIAMLMRGGNFPLAYVYPKDMRATRDLLRRRIKMVRYSGQFKAHVSNTATQYNLAVPGKGSLRLPGGRAAMAVDTRVTRSATPISNGPSLRRRCAIFAATRRHKRTSRNCNVGCPRVKCCPCWHTSSAGASISC